MTPALGSPPWAVPLELPNPKGFSPNSKLLGLSVAKFLENVALVDRDLSLSSLSLRPLRLPRS